MTYMVGRQGITAFSAPILLFTKYMQILLLIFYMHESYIVLI